MRGLGYRSFRPVSPEQEGHQGKQMTAHSTLSPINSSVSKVAKTKSARPRQKRSISCSALHQDKGASIKASSHLRSSKRISTLKQLHVGGAQIGGC